VDQALARPMALAEQQLMLAVIRQHRWAALATEGDEGAEASWVAYVAEPDLSGLLLHLSRLAAHTRNLLKVPRACLAISEQEQAGKDPQLLARVMIQGRVEVIPRGTEDYKVSGRRYRERLPEAEPLFGFGDFMLLRLRPVRTRFVGGFARAYTLDLEGLRKAATLEST
jgi:putative heme iron utilization protein